MAYGRPLLGAARKRNHKITISFNEIEFAAVARAALSAGATFAAFVRTRALGDQKTYFVSSADRRVAGALRQIKKDLDDLGASLVASLANNADKNATGEQRSSHVFDLLTRLQTDVQKLHDEVYFDGDDQHS